MSSSLCFFEFQLVPRYATGECAMALLEVLQATPGVLAVQRNGLTSMWALIALAGPTVGLCTLNQVDP
jgi:hypothetical protein